MEDPVLLTQSLIRYPSITPQDHGSLGFIQGILEKLGFTCHLLHFGEETPVANLYARKGSNSPHLCFAGHVDVVPPGEAHMWHHDPFAGHIEGDMLYGRGAVDMKGALGAFLGALHDFMDLSFSGSLSLLITADEEGDAIHGTAKVLKWLEQRQERFDHCLIGEPSSQKVVGDLIKIGRRGSMNTVIEFLGTQGHVAYPTLADNPIPRALKTLDRLRTELPKNISHYFDETHLEITSVDVNNPTVNIIPAQATVRFNIRFNDQSTSPELQEWIHKIAQESGMPCRVSFQVSGEADLCQDQDFIELVQGAIKKETNVEAKCSTRGGTSDGRFIRHMAPVLELGLLCQTMHQANECVPLRDLRILKSIYYTLLCDYFQTNHERSAP
jgi:succinyl-diaminopimelate desuccinylase